MSRLGSSRAAAGEERMAERGRYHHGDLRKALIEAGLDVIEREGPGALSFRGVAARAGVSHAAPAHHFPSLKAFETALATVAFRRFDAAMAEARAAAPVDAASQLRAAGAGYQRFATGNPGLFRLMFSADRLDWTDPELGAAAGASREQLTAIAAPAADALGLDAPEERLRLEHLVWATAHGFAHLTIDGKLGADAEPPDLARLIFGPTAAIEEA